MTEVIVETSLGSFAIALDRERAPISVDNFLAYVDAGHYADTLFHRVIDGYMIQGGGYATDHERVPTGEPIRCEADNGLLNLRGTVAMARQAGPHTATAQFFVNVADCPVFDHSDTTDRGWGYAVFGRVVRGIETVDAIRAVPTGPVGPFRKDAPLEPVVIHAIRRAT